jgi:hypothetical protein
MIMIKDILTDIVAHTHALGFLSIIKVTTEDGETIIESLSEDKNVIFKAKTKNPINDFDGTFGMANLDKLSLLLKNPEYKENGKIEAVKTGNNVTLHFENESSDFANSYRLMATSIVNAVIKPLEFKGANWDVSFTPSLTSIQRLKLQAQVHSSEDLFSTRVEDKNLVCSFGDGSSHTGNFIFQTKVGKMKNEIKWPVQHVLAILNLSGDCTMHICDQGLMMITVDSGIAEYNYILPAQSK